ncbi:MAG: kinase [Candidatus Omnitrophica bacterium]|nr:kinase [Candidatus Omnitrophota bacterium]
MIISRTPFRVSFFGGGTDYNGWFGANKGAVLATTIDKYCYITCRYLPSFFEHKSRIIYSKIEHAQGIDDIDHPSVREVLRFLGINDGIEIHHDGDLPARTGLGSSSAFTVGLLNALYALKGTMTTKERLAKEAIHVEQDMIKENVGCQDQMLAAYGGFNYIEFGGTNHLRVQPVTLSAVQLNLLQDHLMLFFTGFSRTASQIAQHQIKNIPNKKVELERMYEMVGEALAVLNSNDVLKFGKLLDESWKLKRTLSDKISTGHIDDLYDAAIRAGAIGGKLLGAGGGGFILFFVQPHNKPKVREALGGLLEVPIKFENLGSQIIFFQPDTGIVK